MEAGGHAGEDEQPGDRHSLPILGSDMVDDGPEQDREHPEQQRVEQRERPEGLVEVPPRVATAVRSGAYTSGAATVRTQPAIDVVKPATATANV